ncbi:MAG TPA: redoxin domain-containing protein [Pirellulaceae bacterium]|nr:redoxin domain-containing protein [Pirellulaceae bacterium]HMO93292.1 redoxin domain-containing protein [Pirellulaceae bacterium]HMP70168.1 redoxin domain-containing protein [Pirellulaceae bacterium]
MKTEVCSLMRGLVAICFGTAICFSVVQVSYAKYEHRAHQQDVDTDELIQQAEDALRSGDFQKACDLLEEVIKAKPEDMEWRLNLSGLHQQLGMRASQQGENEASLKHYVRSGELARAVRDDGSMAKLYGAQLKAFFGQVFYNEACAFALQRNKERAMASLKEAFESGFNQFDLASEDEDLASIRDTEEFAELLKTQKELAVTRMLNETKQELSEFESFDFDFELTDVEGRAVALKDFNGKVLIVDFWGTWCPPCREEIPSFIKLKKKYGSDGFDIIGLNNEMTDDTEEAVQKIKKFMTENDMNYNCAVSSSEVEDQVDIEGFPTTLFIDRSGKVRLKLVGLHSYEKLESVVDALLKEQKN